MHAYNNVGDCCGTMCIEGFWHIPTKEYVEQLKYYIKNYTVRSKKRKTGIILVVTLQQRQIAWLPVLEDLGFKVVHKWKNRNTRNFLRMLTLNTGPECD